MKTEYIARQTPRGGPDGDAGAKLEQWLITNNKSRGWMSKEMGIRVSHLGQLINGKRSPSAPTKKLIAIMTDGYVDIESWPYTPRRSKCAE